MAKTYLATLLVLGIAVTVEGLIPGVGPCRIKPKSDYNMNFTQFATENNGIWSYMLAQDQELTKNLIRMALVLKPTPTEGKYSFTIYIQNKGERHRKTLSTFLHDEEHGIATIDAMDGNEPARFTATIMRYDPNEFAAYYIFSDRGGDNTIDYRFALAHKALTTEQKKYMKNLQKIYNFRGKLKTLIK